MNYLIKAAVLGCTGYTGIELVNILINHPNVKLSFLGSKSHPGDYINNYDERDIVDRISSVLPITDKQCDSNGEKCKKYKV